MTLSRHRRQMLLAAAAVAVIVCADRGTKLLAHKYLATRGSVKVIGWLYLTYLENTGAAFSIMRGMNKVNIAASIGILACLIAYRRLVCSCGRLAVTGMIFIIGGALGNLWDRLVYGAVTDFIDFKAFPAVFNVADSFITTGGVLLGLAMYLAEKKEGVS